MRSFCRRSIITTSTSCKPRLHVVEHMHAERFSTPFGSRVRGAITRTSGTPSVVSAWISERATRECITSPTIATRSWVKSFCSGGS